MIDIVIALAALATLAVVGWLAKVRTRQMQKRVVHRQEFFAAAYHLIDDPRTPAEIIGLIREFSAVLDSRRLLWRFLFDLVSGRLRSLFIDPPTAAQRVFDQLQAMPRPLQDVFATAAVNFALAMTYNNVLIGTLIRRVIFVAVTRSSRSGHTGDGTTALVTDVLYHAPRGQFA